MKSVRTSVVLDAVPGRVWRAWADPDDLVCWIWPPRFESRAGIDARVGGRFSLASEVTGMGVSGEYLEVDQPKRLRFTWCWDGEDRHTEVRVELAAAGERTELTLTHEGFATEEERAEHQQGWEDCLARLPAHLAADG